MRAYQGLDSGLSGGGGGGGGGGGASGGDIAGGVANAAIGLSTTFVGVGQARGQATRDWRAHNRATRANLTAQAQQAAGARIATPFPVVGVMIGAGVGVAMLIGILTMTKSPSKESKP